MSLVSDLLDIQSRCKAMEGNTRRQQHIYHQLITQIVAMRQRRRLDKDFETADELRNILLSIGVEIVQGTAGYRYEDIPNALRGRQINDTWRLED